MDMKKVIQLIGISLIIVVLPAASWYFLDSGLDYRMESIDKLGSYGDMPVVSLQLSNERPADVASLTGKMVIVHMLPADADTTQAMKIYRQFGKSKDLHFIFTDNADLRLKADRVDNLWLIEPELNDQFLADIGIEKVKDENYDTALIDVHGSIRSYYDLNKDADLKQMIEHTAFLLPVEETAKPVMKRESEK